MDIVDVLVVTAHVLSADLMPQVRQSRTGEGALAPFDLELVVMKLLENLAQRAEVLLLGGVVDKDVVNKDQNPMAIEWCQNCVHAPLEVAGPQVRPYTNTLNSKWSWLVLKAVLCLSSGFIRGERLLMPNVTLPLEDSIQEWTYYRGIEKVELGL